MKSILEDEAKKVIVEAMRTPGQEVTETDLANESTVIDYFEQGAVAVSLLGLVLRGLITPSIDAEGDIAFSLTEDGFKIAKEIEALMMPHVMHMQSEKGTVH